MVLRLKDESQTAHQLIVEYYFLIKKFKDMYLFIFRSFKTDIQIPGQRKTLLKDHVEIPNLLNQHSYHRNIHQLIS